MKKVLFLLAAAALLTAPAASFAMTPVMPYFGGDIDANVIVNVNDATVTNTTGASANTGANMVTGNSGDVLVVTGNAGASAFTSNLVNSNTNLILDDNGCGCEDSYGLDANVIVNVNDATVTNTTGASANTGANMIAGNGGEYRASWNYDESEYSEWSRYDHSHGHGWRRGHRHSSSGASGNSGSSSSESTWVAYPMGGDVTVRTGNAGSASETYNAVNVNTNTIIRGAYDM